MLYPAVRVCPALDAFSCPARGLLTALHSFRPKGLYLGPSLQLLQLGYGLLDDDASAALAAALQALKGLTCLKVMRCFKPAAMVTISLALMGVQRLQVLDLSGNAMSAEGMQLLLQSFLPLLAHSRTLLWETAP